MTVSEDLDWLLNVAPGLLGERGLDCAPSGGRTAVSPGAYHDAMIRALPHVARQRTLNRAWAQLNAFERAVLERHYRPRRHDPGTRAALGEFAEVALWVASNPESLQVAICRRFDAPGSLAVSQARKRAEAAVAAAHRAFLEARLQDARDWAEQEGAI